MNKRVLFAASLTVAAGLAAALASLLLWQPQVFAQGEMIEVTERIIDPVCSEVGLHGRRTVHRHRRAGGGLCGRHRRCRRRWVRWPRSPSCSVGS